MGAISLTELLGVPVFDSSGKPAGRVRELALAPQEDAASIAHIVVKTKVGDCLVPFSAVTEIKDGIRASTSLETWARNHASEGLFLLERDLLDQQVIDVHGRK